MRSVAIAGPPILKGAHTMLGSGITYGGERTWAGRGDRREDATRFAEARASRAAVPASQGPAGRLGFSS